MKNTRCKICSLLLSMLLLMSAAACDNGSKTPQQNVQTKDTPLTSSTTEIEEPDIGEHKDYDKERATSYFSYDILISEQDGTKRGMELYNEGEGLSEFYGTEINAMKDRLGNKINVYSMIVPTACEFYCPSNLRSRITSQEEVQTNVHDMLVNVEEVNVFPTLRNHNAENIYFRTDNRWTGLGAYYAGKVFAKKAGVPYADISDYNAKTISTEYVGNLSDSVDNIGQADLNANPDTFIYYEPKCRFTTHYYDEEFEYLGENKFFEEVPDSLYDSYYKGGYYCLKLSTTVNSARKLIIVKDSFGTVLAPFLTSSFSEIYVVDADYLEANLVEMIEEFCITDVLYLFNTFSVTGSRVYNLETLRSQASHGTLQDDAPSEVPVDDSVSSTTSNIDSDTDSSNMEFVYDIGRNNPIAVIIKNQYIDINDYYNNIDYYTSMANEPDEVSSTEENEFSDDGEYYEEYYNEYYDEYYEEE